MNESSLSLDDCPEVQSKGSCTEDGMVLENKYFLIVFILAVLLPIEVV